MSGRFSQVVCVKNQPTRITTMCAEPFAKRSDNFWFTEYRSEFVKHDLALKQIVFDGYSKYQHIQIIDTVQFGRTLLVDGCTQSSEKDEHIYHESMVHPAMLLHPTPVKSVFIGGGGEFATAREVLRHHSVDRVVMVDIDKLACDICRDELPNWGKDSFNDKRLHVIHEDAYKWLAESSETFDVILMDICDPIEGGPGYKLYTREFYESLKGKLNPGGIFVTQSGPGSEYNAKENCFTVIHNTLEQAFDFVIPYSVDVPSFGSQWGFNIASNMDVNYLKKDIDRLIEERITGGHSALKFLDGVSWFGLFGLSKILRQDCKEETRVMTIDQPFFMFDF